MTQQTNSPRAVSNRTPRALELPSWVRVVTAAIGVILIVVGAFAIFRVGSPELGGTALAIAGAALVVVSLLGLMPSRVSAGGVEVEFGKSAVEELLQTIGTQDADLMASVADLLQRNASDVNSATEVGDVARRIAAEDSKSDERRGARAVGSAPTTEAEALTVLRTQPNFVEKAEIEVTTRGRRPIVSATFRVDDVPVAVDVKDAWNATVERLVNQRLLRILNSSDIMEVAALVPRESLAAARAALDGQILVAAIDQAASLPDLIRAARTS